MWYVLLIESADQELEICTVYALQVISSRHSSPCKMASIVKVVPDPRRVHPHANLYGSSSADALFYFTLSNDLDSTQGEDGTVHGWYIMDVKVVPVQFVNAWSRTW